MQTDLEQRHIVAQRLRTLASEAWQRAPYSWEEFQRRASGSSPTRHPASRQVTIAAARVYLVATATLLMLVVSAALWMRGADLWSKDGLLALRRFHAVRNVGPGVPAVAAGNVSDQQVAAMSSRAAERWLADLPSEPAIVEVGTHVAVAGLEDRLAQVDDLLSAESSEGTRPAYVMDLRRQRAQLLSSLAQVRFAETMVAGTR